MAIEVTVVGAAGRMGRRTLALIDADERFELNAAVDTQAAQGVTTDLDGGLRGADVVIDFSAPPACTEVAPQCAAHGAALLVASTGLSDADREALTAASEKVAVLPAANLSVGVNALAELIETAVQRLGADFDVEIFEMHHKHKRDAPSGTAHLLSAAAIAARPELREVLGRSGTGVRNEDELGIGAARGGDVAGEHTVFLFGEGERLELTHRATTADIFARGALRAAAWLNGRPAGLYGMRDVLR